MSTEVIVGNEFADKTIPLIKEAKHTIDIVVFDWLWYPDQVGSKIQKFNNAIITAAKKGVNVKALTIPYTTIGILKQNNIKARKLETERKLHAKLMILDRKIAILGSHNYTMSAFTTNYEVSVILRDFEVVLRLRQFFYNIWPGG